MSRLCKEQGCIKDVKYEDENLCIEHSSQYFKETLRSEAESPCSYERRIAENEIRKTQITIDHKIPPITTVDDYHHNVDPDYNRERKFQLRNEIEIKILKAIEDNVTGIKPENLEKIELLLKIAKQLRVTRREIYLYIRGGC